MVPLRDENPTRITPYVTYGLIAINVLIFFYQLSLSRPQLASFFQVWAVVPRQLSASFQGAPPAPGQVDEWITLFTSQFLHGGIFHLGGNMLYLWIFGNNIEEELGRVRFLIFYLLCGALAALTQWFFSPASVIPALGASGAIAGVMGAYIIKFPNARILTLLPLFFIFTTIRVPAIFFLGFWFIQQAFYGLASLGETTQIGMESGGVAYWAHAGGFIFGVILGPLLGLFASSSSRNRR
ncbi:MAG: rhomboid family intramembrane serine protease [Cyanothece sp. SIO1E1]|nr:rhomboid family intramembrane serine protease [Cyanothece sp. SIO1E1]